jgi:predicted extracellular nuclease
MAKFVPFVLFAFFVSSTAVAAARVREETDTAGVPVSLADLVRGKGRYQGERVRINEPLTVSQADAGRLILSSGGRLEEPTNRHSAGSPEARRVAEGNVRRCVVLESGAKIHRAGSYRAGDLVNGVAGRVVPGPAGWDGRTVCATRLRPTVLPGLLRANPRPPVPAVGGTLRIAAFNVRNYFTTINQQGAACFPSRTRRDCRGETSEAGFARQGARLVEVLRALDADVLGLMEVENNGETAMRELVDDLNAALGARIYASVGIPAGGTGGDATRIAMIYRPGRLSAVGRAVGVTDPAHFRPPLVQTFVTADGRKIRIATVHFKSKAGCPRASDRRRGNDVDQGQGCWNKRRTRQAVSLIRFLNRDRIPTLVVGDLNAYGREDPVLAFTRNGFVDEVARFNEFAYSYVFDGKSGYLDHALASSDLGRYVTGAAHWHINADESPAAGDDTAYRSSDHDPVLVGIDFGRR